MWNRHPTIGHHAGREEQAGDVLALIDAPHEAWRRAKSGGPLTVSRISSSHRGFVRDAVRVRRARTYVEDVVVQYRYEALNHDDTSNA